MLVAGGWAGSRAILASAELYDPASGRFAAVGSLAHARYSHDATSLSDGRVLISGGIDAGAQSLKTAEVFDPSSGSFGPTASMAFDRWADTATLLPDGSVLVAGGVSNTAALTSAELWWP